MVKRLTKYMFFLSFNFEFQILEQLNISRKSCGQITIAQNICELFIISMIISNIKLK